jgi:hypothetical protein
MPRTRDGRPDGEQVEQAEQEREWTEALAVEALGGMGEWERQLLWRLAEARGRRVPLSSLAATLGLPASAAIDNDFPALTNFCHNGNDTPRMPVQTGGVDPDSWYWMSPADSRQFRLALESS